MLNHVFFYTQPVRATRLLGLYYISIAMLVCGTATGQTANETINFEQAVTSTLTLNPSLRGYGIELQAQDARILQASIKPLPELTIDTENVLGTAEYQALKSAQTTFNITWILERGSREKLVDAARAGSSVIADEISIRRLDAVAETARRYLLCLELQTRMSNAMTGVKLAQDAVAAIEIRVNAGSTPSAEVARAKAEFARRKLIVEDIEHELLSAYYRLGAQWGESQPSFVRVSGNIFAKPQVESFEALQEKLAQNPDLTRFLSKQRLNDAELALAQAKNRQSWRVSAGFRQLEATSDQAFVAGITIPLGKQNSNRGKVEEVRANIAKTEFEAAAEKVRLETELYVLYQELRHSQQLADALTGNILPLYEQALLETRQAYDLGRYSYMELNAAQSELLAARDDLIDASMGIFEHLIEIERLTGVQVDVPQFAP